MGILSTIILVVCVIVCIILVLLVLVQNEDGGNTGGLFGGGANSTFGARSASALAKITRWFVFIFFALVFTLAMLNRSKNTGFEDEVKKQQQEQSTEWWKTNTDKKKNSDENTTDIETNAETVNTSEKASEDEK